MKKNYGFTLLELIVALSVLGVLLAIATPNFRSLIENNRLTTQANDFVIAANIARSEAIKRNSNVVICRSADGESCSASGGWEQGWVVFVDDVTVNDNLDAGETVLKIFPPLTGKNIMRASATFTTSVTYLPRGFTSASGTLVLCDDRNNNGSYTDADDFNTGKAIRINLTGRPSVTRAVNSGFTNCITP